MGNFKITHSTVEKWVDDLEFMFEHSKHKNVDEFIKSVYQSETISYNQTAITIFCLNHNPKLILEFEPTYRYGELYISK